MRKQPANVLDTQLQNDVVLIGGGHAHAMVLRMWGMDPQPETRLTLVSPEPTAPYTGMLPGHVAGHYSRADLDIDLVKLARFAGARLVLGAATAIDPVARRILVSGHGDIAYDVASVDIGIHAEMPTVAGFADHGVAVKPLDRFAGQWRSFMEKVHAGQIAPDICVIGAGVGGVELVMAMANALRSEVGNAAHIHVIEAGPQIAGRNPQTTQRLAAALDGLGVTVLTQAQVIEIQAEKVVLADGRSVPSCLTVSATGARAHDWITRAPLPLTEDGFIRVDRHLQVEGHPDLFAVGDCAHMTHAPRPKAGVFAVRSGKVLLHNLRAQAKGAVLRPYWPQKDYLKLISLGGRTALAEKWGRTFSGPLLWRVKDHIDTGFMRQFRDLPSMSGAVPPRPGDTEDNDDLRPLCAGCGSKLGSAALGAGLAYLPSLGRRDVLNLPGDDAAILQVGGEKQVITTDHLRAFCADPALMARIAAVHALGDVWAMGARPQAALASVILPRMVERLQARSMEEVLRAAAEVFHAAGAEIVGGHSTMGAEMTLGFTVTGLLENREAITLKGARPGDCLILTRPLGSGTLLAAEMQGAADGTDIAAMLAIMATPQGDAAAVLHNAHAMTDVTGFGFAGHLLAMCRASAVAADVFPRALPLYQGVLELAEKGYRSSLWAANKLAAPVEGAQGAIGVLMHDPQTAGGFLAAIAPEEVDEVLARLQAAGHDATVVGHVRDDDPSIRVQPR